MEIYCSQCGKAEITYCIVCGIEIEDDEERWTDEISALTADNPHSAKKTKMIEDDGIFKVGRKRYDIHKNEIILVHRVCASMAGDRLNFNRLLTCHNHYNNLCDEIRYFGKKFANWMRKNPLENEKNRGRIEKLIEKLEKI